MTEVETALGMLGQVWSAVIGWSDWLLRLEMPVWLYEYLDAIFIAVMVVSFGIWSVELFWFTRKVRKVDM